MSPRNFLKASISRAKFEKAIVRKLSRFGQGMLRQQVFADNRPLNGARDRSAGGIGANLQIALDSSFEGDEKIMLLEIVSLPSTLSRE